MAVRTMSGQLRLGLGIAAATLVADQATKLGVLSVLKLELGEVRTITPFLDLILTFNRGISYGLWPQDTEFGRNLLVLVSVLAAALFCFWLTRNPSRLTAAGLGLLIGGALGNAIDRALYGAVLDFLSFHAGGWRWYVFNLADAAIVAGVVGLLYDALFRATKTPPSG